MADSTRTFLTNGPSIAGDPGDITAGRAYHVVHRQITEAINKAAEKEDQNSKRVIDELKALRSHFKEEAERYSTKKISQLPPDIANEFLEVNRLIKNITGRVPGSGPPPTPGTAGVHHQLHSHHGHYGGGFVNTLSSGPIGAGVLAASQAVLPGSAIIVKAIQENSHLITQTFRALGHVSSFLIGVYDLTKTTFSAVYNFLNPNHPNGLVNALGKLFGGKGGGGGGLLSGIFRFIGDLVTGRVIGFVLKKMLPGLLAGFRFLGGLGVASIVIILAKKWWDHQREKTKDWTSVVDLGKLFGEDIFTIKVDPQGRLARILEWFKKKEEDNTGGTTRGFLNPQGGVVRGGSLQQSSDLGLTRGIEPLKVGASEDFNTGIVSGEDTVLQLLSKQTDLLAKILRAILTGGGSGSGFGSGYGFIRAYQSGGQIPPNQDAIVGDRGLEIVEVGGKRYFAPGPTAVRTGNQTAKVSPVGGNFPRETVSSSYVSPIGNPNVNQDILRGQVASPGYIRANIRMNNPGAISIDPGPKNPPSSIQIGTGGLKSPGSSIGDPRGSDEGATTRYTRFDTPEQGIQAQHDLLLKKVSEGNKSVEDIIVKGGWAAKGQSEYVTSIAKTLGVPRTADLHLDTDKDMLQRFQMAQSAYEAGSKQSPYPEELFRNVVYGTPQEHPSQVNPEMPWPRVPTKGSGTPWKDVIPSTPPDTAVASAGTSPIADGRSPISGSPARQSANLNIKDHPTSADQSRHIDSFRSTERQIKTQQQQKPKPAPRPAVHQRKAQKSTGTTFSSAGFITTGGGFA